MDVCVRVLDVDAVVCCVWCGIDASTGERDGGCGGCRMCAADALLWLRLCVNVPPTPR